MDTKPVILGKSYTDTISGFTGVATSRHVYLYGCVRVGLEAGKDGLEVKVEVFDEQRLVEEESGAPVVTTATSGGPQRSEPTRSH